MNENLKKDLRDMPVVGTAIFLIMFFFLLIVSLNFSIAIWGSLFVSSLTISVLLAIVICIAIGKRIIRGKPSQTPEWEKE